MSPDATRQAIRNLIARLCAFGSMTQGRYELFETFKRLPLLNASIGITANPDFEINGTGTVANADQAFDIGGGILISTDAATPAANENTYVTPHLDALQSAWAKAGLWGSEDEVMVETQVNLPSIALMHARFGLFEDAAQPSDLALTGSDDNAAFFLFDEDNATSGTQWLCVVNVAGVDTVVASGVTVAAATEYKLRVELDADRAPHFYINDRQVYQGPVMTDAVNLVPQIAVGTDTTAIKTMAIRYLRASRDL